MAIAYLCLVNKLAFLLSVIILLLATIPCCLADNCYEVETPTEQSNKQKDTGKEKDCNLCSPFFRCHDCNGFAFANAMPKIILLFFPERMIYPVYCQNFVLKFAPSIWQPPKIA